MTTKQIPVWIDCDTGTDDSVAIMLAHALPELSVVALSAVAGNSPLYNTFPNTRRIVHLLGADYPVYPGAERPLVREPHVAGKFHGENGLGDVELPLPDCAPETTPAWDALYQAAKRMPGELRLVATGPLTNVAIALTKYPELKTLLHSIALMGGAAVGGNVTPAAEFNIYDDPDAAQIVFKSGVPLVMCGLDVTMQAELRPADWDEMAGYSNRCGSLVRELFACAWSAVQTVGLTGVAQHDSCPVLYLAHPDLFLFNGDEAVFDREYRRLCREVKKRNIPLEINFLGLMEERWYPNEKFWKIAGEEGNTAVFGCDAHTPKAVWNPETEQKALQLAAKYGLKVQETVPMPKTF